MILGGRLNNLENVQTKVATFLYLAVFPCSNVLGPYLLDFVILFDATSHPSQHYAYAANYGTAIFIARWSFGRAFGRLQNAAEQPLYERFLGLKTAGKALSVALVCSFGLHVSKAFKRKAMAGNSVSHYGSNAATVAPRSRLEQHSSNGPRHPVHSTATPEGAESGDDTGQGQGHCFSTGLRFYQFCRGLRHVPRH